MKFGKTVIDTTREEVKTQEPPTITPQVTNVQPLDKIPKIKLIKVDTVEGDKVETQATTDTQSQIGQIDLFASPAQVQGAIQGNVAEKDKPEESELTPKLKEQETIQALVTLPESGTPSNHTLQRLSTNATPL